MRSPSSLHPITSSCLVLFAFAARVLPHIGRVIMPGGIVPADTGDVYYHVRRIQLTTLHWPRVPDFDAWLSFPDGAYCPWPPLFDFIPATFARLTGIDAQSVAVFWPPLLGALTLVPLAALAARLYGRAAAVCAAIIFAILPANIAIAGIGHVDHHVAEVLLQVWLYAWLLRDLHELEHDRAPTLRSALGLGALMGGCLLTWMGSVLFLIVPAAIVNAWALPPRSSVDASRAARHLAIAYVVAAVLALPYGALNLVRGRAALGFFFISLLQPALCLVFAAAVLGCAWIVAPARRGKLAQSGLRLLGAALVAALPLLVGPVRAGLAGGLGFITRKGDAFADQISESVPLLSSLHTRMFAYQHVGYGHYALAALIAVLLLRLRHTAQRDANTWLLCAWALHTTVLAATQSRFLYYAAAVICILPAAMWHILRPRGPTVAALTAAACVTAIVPAFVYYWSPLFGLGQEPAVPMSQISADRIVFLGKMLRVTPPAGDPTNPDARPGYCVFTPWDLGHETVALGERPVVANNFGAYLEGGSYEDARVFYGELREERDAMQLLQRRGCRYVATVSGATPFVAGAGQQRFARRLHAANGSESAEGPGAEHFRLVAESPNDDVEGLAEHKLFALVSGAELRFESLPPSITRVRAALRLEGHDFDYTRTVQPDSGTTGNVRVSYPGDYHILVGSEDLGTIVVSNDAVERGQTLLLRAR